MKYISLILAVGALLVGALVAPAHAGDLGFGRLWAGDKILREGCHNYRYQYVVRPRTNDWLFETFLHAPSGRTIASNTMDSSANRKRCNGMPGPLLECTKHVRWVKPGYFRMHR
jgi:hypothetical protein